MKLEKGLSVLLFALLAPVVSFAHQEKVQSYHVALTARQAAEMNVPEFTRTLLAKLRVDRRLKTLQNDLNNWRAQSAPFMGRSSALNVRSPAFFSFQCNS